MVKVSIVQNILAANDSIAEEISHALAARGIRAINLMSSPGAGKITLLEQTIKRLRERLTIGVIEGDLETTADAERIEAAGAESIQIKTQGMCHLEAHMVQAALTQLDLERIDLLFIENVGNLVCPADWKLGEDLRVVVVSTTEGDEKPAKYPPMFAVSQIMIVNKLDLLPYIDFDMEKVRRDALAINPTLRIFEVSCRTGEGLDAWCNWLVDFTRSTGEGAGSLVGKERNVLRT
ncbi:MAG: hydrogenase nickel incorporation protein HypB [Ktedonobacteraceae bacterium]